MDERSPVVFAQCAIDAAPGVGLVAAMRDEIAELYPGVALDGPDMPKAGPKELGPPAGDFLVGYEGELAVCCGGVKRLDSEACEIKRMYVIPQARGRGTARVLLGALEARGRELGYAIARLDTGPLQPASRHLFGDAGYRPIANFNGNPIANFFGEKTLQEEHL